MRHLNFHKTAKKNSPRTKPTRADLYVRYNETKNGHSCYIGIKEHFVHEHRLFVTDGTFQVVKAAVDTDAKILVGNAGNVFSVPEDAVMTFRSGDTQTSFFNSQTDFVEAFLKAFLVDTTKKKHLFKLEPDGDYFGEPRFKIVFLLSK